MPVYQFEALDAQGGARKGTLEADTARAARTALRAQHLIPLQVQPVAADAVAAAEWLATGFRPRFLPASGLRNAANLAIWTRQLAGLVSAGLPLERALGALAQESDNPPQQRLVAHLRAEVNAGSSFAKALQLHPHEFSANYMAVVAAGEHSGSLGEVLEKLADDLEAQQEIRSKLISASLYPLIVTAVALVIVVFLLTYVVPQVANVFTSSRRALPLLTTFMLGFSQFVRQWGLLLLAGLVAGGYALLQARQRSDALRRRLDAWWLRLPLVGALARNYNAARFASTVALLVQAGVPILKALQAANGTLSNRAMQVDAEDVLVLVREGAPLGSALAQKKSFPTLVGTFARLGEQTGQLPLMLGRVATQLSAQVQRRAMRLATILEPLLIVVMGLLVMLIVLAVLMPIIQLNQMVR